MTALSAPHPARQHWPFLALLAGGVAVGFSPIFVRLSDLAPIASGFYRLALALPALWLMAQYTPADAKDDTKPGARDWWLLVATGFIFAADIICWHLALVMTTVADATLIGTTTPILVALGAFILFGERLKPLFMAGLASAIAGVCLLALQKQGANAAHRLAGDALAIGASLSYAAYLLLVARLRRRHSTGRIVMYTTVVSALALLPITWAFSPTLLPATAMGWAAVIGMALISHVAGQSLLTYALAHLPAAYSSMTQFMQAAIAVFAAWAILGEPLTALTLASAAAILFGIALCRRSGATT
jgi:drug/metabolite transporter (DMT)-like permease